ncbi:hypothetical protein ACROYT_G016367 [Oculina patagonica]
MDAGFRVKEGSPSNEEIEKLSQRIAVHWKILGRRLNIEEATLTAIHKENEEYSEKAYQMLLQWKKRYGSAATYQVLHDALAHILVNRKDLAEEFFSELETPLRAASAVKEGSPSNEEIEKLSQRIAVHWKILGRRLNIEEATLTAIHKENEEYSEKAYQMLLQWKKRYGSAATYQVLHDALAHILVNRKDLAEEFFSELETPLRAASAVKEESPSNEEIEKLSQRIAVDWESLGRCLNIEEATLTAIHKENEKYSEKAYQMLLQWKKRYGSAATYQVLHDALAHILVNRKDLAEEFHSELETPLRAASAGIEQSRFVSWTDHTFYEFTGAINPRRMFGEHEKSINVNRKPSGDLSFEIKTGVRQGCVMSSVLFNIAIDWVLRRTMEDQHRGIRWTPFFTLEDLDFVDDIALLSHTRQHIQEKTDRLSMFSAQVGLKISLKKTEAMCVNVSSPSKIRVAGQDISYTDKFTYLGSMLCQDGGTGVDIQNRLNKARGAFMSLRPMWRSASYSTKTKLRIYQSCVLSTLLYGCECWRMTEHDLSKLASFHTTSLRKILRIFWPQKISNDQLLKQTKQEDIRTIFTWRRWRWIGHVLRKDNNNIAKTAMRWTPEGKRKRGRPKQHGAER